MTKPEQIRQVVMDAYAMLRDLEVIDGDAHDLFTTHTLSAWNEKFEGVEENLPDILKELSGLGLDLERLKTNLGI